MTDLAEEVRATCSLLDMFRVRLVEELSVAETRKTDLLLLGVITLSERQIEALNEKLDKAIEWACVLTEARSSTDGAQD